jgi:hypothetical protein
VVIENPHTRRPYSHAVRRFLNPALSVRAERYSVVEGKTPEITIEHARALLRSICVSY